MKFKSRRNNQNKETLEEFTGEIEVIEEEQTLDELISPDFDEIEYYDEDLNQIEAPKKRKKTKKKKNKKEKTQPILPENNELNPYQEEVIEYNEETIKDDYLVDEYQDFNELPKIKKNKIKLIINIIFTIIMISMAMIAIDVISVARYDKGPYFAIKLNEYKDGGTKEYYGIGYKVIKYNQIQGRRDKEIGLWTLKYNTEPITFRDIDLAIEFNNNPNQTYKKYYKKFVRVMTTLKSSNQDKNEIIVGYNDEDGKYTIDIVCEMAEKVNNSASFEVGKETTIIGTITDFDLKTEEQANKLVISNCFAAQ